MTRADVRTLEEPAAAAGRQAALFAFSFVRTHLESVSVFFSLLRPGRRGSPPGDDRW